MSNTNASGATKAVRRKAAVLANTTSKAVKNSVSVVTSKRYTQAFKLPARKILMKTRASRKPNKMKMIGIKAAKSLANKRKEKKTSRNRWAEGMPQSYIYNATNLFSGNKCIGLSTRGGFHKSSKLL